MEQRKIIFRAFENGKMMSFVNILLIDEAKAYPHGRDYMHNSMEWEVNELMSNPILMQFTGLKDKNGTAIYEGDVVKYDNNQFSDLIEFHAPSFVRRCNDYSLRNQFYPLMKTEQCEVIGNIYENKTMVKW